MIEIVPSSPLAAWPGRNKGRGGRPGDPLNIAFAGEADTLRRALRAAGWREVPLSPLASLAAGLAELPLGKGLHAFPPMNRYRLRGRLPDQQWARAVGWASRHHFRLWRMDDRDDKGRPLWWGSGNFDATISWSNLSHRPDPDTNKERDFLAASLADSPEVEKLEHLALPQIPRDGVNDKSYPFRNDGRCLVVVLKVQLLDRRHAPGHVRG